MRRQHLGLGALLLLTCTRPPAPAAPVPRATPTAPAPDPDSDSDGFLDSVDRCRADPGSEPDGCPIPDSDGDGYLDPYDRCVTRPETINGIADDDGCPDTLPPEGCSRIDGSPPSALFGPAAPPSAAQRPLLAPLPDVARLADAGVTVLPHTRDARGFFTDPQIQIPLSPDDTGLRDLERLVAVGGFADTDLDPAELIQIADALEPLAPDWQLTAELGPCPWDPRHRLARVRVQAPPPANDPRQIALLVETGAATAAAWPSIHAALLAFVATLAPGDRVALFSLGADPRLLVPATSDRAALLAALTRLTTPSLATPAAVRPDILAAGRLDPALPGPRHAIVVGHTAPADVAALHATTVHLVVPARLSASDAVVPDITHAPSFRELQRALLRAARPPSARPPELEIAAVPGALRGLRWLGGDNPRVLCDGPRIADTDDLVPGEVVTVLLELDVAATRGPLATIALRTGNDPPIRRLELIDDRRATAPSLAMQVARIAAELALLTHRTKPWPALPDIFSARGARRLAALEREAAALIARDPTGAAARLHTILVGLRRAAPTARRHAVALRAHFTRDDDDASYRAEVRAYTDAERRARTANYFDLATRLTAVGTLYTDIFVGLSRRHPALRWELIAHCDDHELADPAVCAAIATRRGEVVRDRLVARGISPPLLTIRPARADERYPQAAQARMRADQRRVDFMPIAR